MLKKERKVRKDPEYYKSDLVWVPNIENLANEQCPIIPLTPPTGDKEQDEENFIMSIRSASENIGFIKGYEYAISIVKQMINNSISDAEEDVLKTVFNNLIGY